MKYLREIEQRYKFKFPEEYVRLYISGRFNLIESDHYSKLIDKDYLWVSELEWISPSEILSFDCDPDIKLKFVPFAFNGAGELWCFYPSATDIGEVPVVLCDNLGSGSFEAPNFLSCVLQQILLMISDGCNEVNCLYLKRYLDEFRFPDKWSAELKNVLNQAGTKQVQNDYFETTYQKLVAYKRYSEYFSW